MGAEARDRGGAHPAAGAPRRLGSRAAPTYSPGGAQLRGTRGALTPGCRVAARIARAAVGGPERSMSVGWHAPLPGLRRARRLDARRVGRATAVAWRSRRATFCPLLLPALVLGLPSPPLPSLTTGWTRFRAELEDPPPGAALRLLRRRMRRPPPPGLPPSGAAPGDPGSSPARVTRPERERENWAMFHPPHPHSTTPDTILRSRALLANHCSSH